MRDMNNEEYLEHHGVLGQKWGVRNFQNKDGSLTAKGKARALREAKKDLKYTASRAYESARFKNVYDKELQKAYKRYDKSVERDNRNGLDSPSEKTKMYERNIKNVRDYQDYYKNKNTKALKEYQTKVNNYVKEFGSKSIKSGTVKQIGKSGASYIRNKANLPIGTINDIAPVYSADKLPTRNAYGEKYWDAHPTKTYYSYVPI